MGVVGGTPWLVRACLIGTYSSRGALALPKGLVSSQVIEATTLTSTHLLARRVFSATDQHWFALLSGDSNPMHMDALAARRTQAGARVVHGVHATLWALEAYANRSGFERTAFRLQVRFDRFIYLDRPVEARIVQGGPASFLIEVDMDGAKAASIRGEVEAGATSPAEVSMATASASPLDAPKALDLADLEDAFGVVPCSANAEAFTQAFPALTQAFGAGAVASLAALSTLVGMHAPGLHSIFSKFSVILSPSTLLGPLAYRAVRLQPTLRSVELAVTGSGLSGSVGCFVRRPPVAQPPARSLAGEVVGDFANHRVLIIGGSRGLGEITAKLCSVAGADVTITFAVGADDAFAVQQDITSAGGRCRVYQFDAAQPVAPQLAAMGGGFTHVYYFATSQIFRQKPAAVSREVLSDFLAIHLYGFNDLCEALAQGSAPVRIFYPSSVAVDERPKDAVEYVIAKAAGELACDALQKSHRDLQIFTERLPRTDTDQTATVLPVRSRSALEVMKPIVNEMHNPAA